MMLPDPYVGIGFILGVGIGFLAALGMLLWLERADRIEQDKRSP